MWYLQLNPEGIAFWDTYVHPDCSVEQKREDQPFKKMVLTPGYARELHRLKARSALKNTQ